MKSVILLFGSLLIFSTVNSQKWRDTIMINGLTDNQFFDSVNRINRINLCSVEKNYRLYIRFNLTKEGTITNITTAEIPGLPCPEYLKEYISNLIQISNGKWDLTYIKTLDYPKEIIYRVELVKKDYWKEEIKPGNEDLKFLGNVIFKETRDKVPLIRKFDNGGRSLILPMDF